ncbi:MAG TPA: hypothetical protein VLG69_01390 [Candidatus Andersenbacteria bacterium]|nr:hypothetical protein [Candidatus Andersenbacteria bacterium]
MGNRGSVYFIHTTRSILNDKVHEDLMVATYQMLASMKRRHAFRTKNCEGFVSTEMETSSFGNVSGIDCIATFESEGFVTQTRFIVPERMLAVLSTADMYAHRNHATDEISEFRPNPIRDLQRRN